MRHAHSSRAAPSRPMTNWTNHLPSSKAAQDEGEPCSRLACLPALPLGKQGQGHSGQALGLDSCIRPSSPAALLPGHFQANEAVLGGRRHESGVRKTDAREPSCGGHRAQGPEQEGPQYEAGGREPGQAKPREGAHLGCPPQPEGLHGAPLPRPQRQGPFLG